MNLHEMTPQQILDHVARELYRQGGPAMDPSGSCMYRAPDGRKCAFGLFIPDEKYDPDWEGITLDRMVANPVNFRVTELVPPDKLELVIALQNAHDSACNRDREWYEPNARRGIAELLREVARDHRLSAEVINELWREA